VTRRTQRRRGPRGAWLLAVLVARGALATTVTIVNLDGGGEGLNDPTVVAPVGGNPATTRGAQRLRALQEAADRWAAALRSGVEIRVGASFDTDLSCTASSATLGVTAMGPPIANFPGAPLADTWYAPALANRIAGTDLNPGADDIRTKFNALVDGGCAFARTWYYGLDGNPGPTEVDFVSVALHELAHGLGFSSLVDLDTGQKSAGFDDAFSRHLGDQATGKLFPDMTDAERAAASVDTGNLEWVGAATDAASVTLTQGRDASGHALMYAPSPARPGSSVSHFDVSLMPDQLLEPRYTGPNHELGLTRTVLQDIGWDCGNGVLDPGEECDDGNTAGDDCCSSTCTLVPQGGACEDGDACTVGDTCDGHGLCVTGVPRSCDDGNACTEDACTSGTCTNTRMPGVAGVACELTVLRSPVCGSEPIDAKLEAIIRSAVMKAEAKVDASLGAPPRKQAKLRKSARTILAMLRSKAAHAARRHRITAGCRDTIDTHVDRARQTIHDLG